MELGDPGSPVEMVIYTAINTGDEFENVAVTEVGEADWAWLTRA